MVIAEASVIVTVVGWFLSPNIKELMDLARLYAKCEYKWYTGLPEKLEKLADDLDEISGLVGASRAAFVDDPAKVGSLWQLKDAIHDAEELMDTFQYEILKANNLKQLGMMIIGSKESLEGLNELLEKLDRLRQMSQHLFQITGSNVVRSSSRQEKGYLPTKDKLFGYDAKYNDLLSRLMPEDESNSSNGVVAIIGHGGMGKTELARRAFNDQGVKSKFNLLIWACVHGKFTETEILSVIWNSVAGARPVGDMNITSLQLELDKMVKAASPDRRYLLVLDDVCNDESAASVQSRINTWNEVLAPFRQQGGKGSRILMTTRAKICCTTLEAGIKSIVVLDGIDPEASNRMLMKTAFGDEQGVNLPRQLKEAIENISANLHGSPLAVEEVGRELQGNRNLKQWKKVMSSVGGNVYKGVFMAHLSSYQDLSPQLQRCLAFCGIFPKKWRFQPHELTLMWVALGLVESGGETTKHESVARSYFDDLVQRSLFQKEGTENRYVIHEHIHSMLIRLVCPTYYARIDGSSRVLPASARRRVRHLSVTTRCLEQLSEYSDQLKTLRTLLVFEDNDGVGGGASSWSTSSSSFLKKIFKKSKGVRVLDFSHTGITELPENVGDLKHLRYLGLPGTMKKIGDQVTGLLLLQTFIVINGTKDLVLPQGMSGLINLRNLFLGMMSIAQISGIGRLEKLQGPIEFDAGDGEKAGHGIRELENLNSLTGTLRIKNLDKVRSRNDAEKSRLANKESLKVLKLEWGHRCVKEVDSSADSDLDVLDGLQPHPNVETLHIAGYVGIKLPSWCGDAHVLGNLTSLCLMNCKKLNCLPSVGALPWLKILKMKGLPDVETIRPEDRGAFTSLEEFVLDDLPKLIIFSLAGDDGESMFPGLNNVNIVDCPMLTSLEGLLCCRTSLKELSVKNCPALLKPDFTWASFPSLNRRTILNSPGLSRMGD